MKILRSHTFMGETKLGKNKTWRLHLVREGTMFGLQREWWQGNDGKTQFSEPVWAKPRNVGRANATTAEEQALSEFLSIVQRKQARIDANAGGFEKPMLANSFKGRADRVQYPVFVQPKYDGHRMLMDGKRAWTRGLKEHKANVNHLIFETEGYILDGEVMLPKNPLLQKSSSAIKGKIGADSKALHYYVYDVMVDAPYRERQAMLKYLVECYAPANVVLAPTYEAQDEAEVASAHMAFVKQGYEGAIIRQDGRGYEHTRTDQLLKLKNFQDAEFKVVDIVEGKGSFQGKAICVCALPGGAQFRAVPEGDSDYREMVYRNRAKFVGKYLTVRYQTLSEKGVPVFPVGVEFRSKGEF